jgi:hypothetical protein
LDPLPKPHLLIRLHTALALPVHGEEGSSRRTKTVFPLG